MRSARFLHLLPVFAALVLGLGLSRNVLSSQEPSATLHGDAAHPAKTTNWVNTQLYFGLGPAEDASKGVSEADWRAFLDKEVTPRFPAGLSVVDVYGQWQGKGQAAPEHIRSKMLIIDYPETAANERSIEAIRVAWKAKTHDQSVMKVTEHAEVSF
ncbi:MAG TPA: DUF3574 domain-containing protein [Acidobacteriaceae bacterium]